MTTQKIAIAGDHAGFELKTLLASHLREKGFDVTDLGTNDTQSVDYPDYASAMAKWLEANTTGSGILICGSGIGISIAANRHTHVRAALCHDGLGATLARKHNDANVLCLGARLIGSDVAKDCVEHFLNTAFEGGRHETRVKKLS
jgi:ribose 5-phosphate isomerase B